MAFIPECNKILIMNYTASRVILHSRLVSVKHNLPSKMKFIIVE